MVKMAHERAERFLESVKQAKERARHAQEEVLEIEAFLDVQGFNPGKERVSGSRNGDRLAEQLHRLDERRDELARLIEEWLGYVCRADEVINLIPDARYVQCLNMHYLEERKWDDVAIAMSYAQVTVRGWKNPALKALELAIDEYEKNRS